MLLQYVCCIRTYFDKHARLYYLFYSVKGVNGQGTFSPQWFIWFMHRYCIKKPLAETALQNFFKASVNIAFFLDLLFGGRYSNSMQHCNNTCVAIISEYFRTFTLNECDIQIDRLTSTSPKSKPSPFLKSQIRNGKIQYLPPRTWPCLHIKY